MNPRAQQTQRVKASPNHDPYAFRTLTISQLEDRESETRAAGLVKAANAIRYEIKKRVADANRS